MSRPALEPIESDTEPPPAMRFPPVSDPMGQLVPLTTMPDDAVREGWSDEQPTKKTPVEPIVISQPLPGPCPTPFGMAAPHAARAARSAPGRRVGHGPGRWMAYLAVAVASTFAVGVVAAIAIYRLGAASPKAAEHLALTSMTGLSVAPPDDSLDRIRRGDPEAMSGLEAVPRHNRTATQNMALADGRSVRKLTALAAISHDAHHAPSAQGRRAALAKLRPFLADGETAKPALSALASFKGPEGPDWLYEIWTGTTERTELTLLARDLVLSADVRPHASDALAATLKLRDAETCEQVRDALPHVWAHGDRRALTTLVRIAKEYPCQSGRTEQCHPCLDGAVSLPDVIEAVRHRPSPSLP